MSNLKLVWTHKAENDFVVASELLDLYLEATTDSICFHSEQCAEKYIKAYLIDQALDYNQAESLLDWLLPCLHHDNVFLTISSQIKLLDDYSLDTLNPGQATNLKDAAGAVKAVEAIRALVRSKLDAN